MGRRRLHMPAYVPLIDWTGQGARTVKGAPNRRGQAEALAEKHGVRFGQVYCIVGPQDDVVVVPEDDENATAIMVLELSGHGGRPQDDDASSLRPR